MRVHATATDDIAARRRAVGVVAHTPARAAAGAASAPTSFGPAVELPDARGGGRAGSTRHPQRPRRSVPSGRLTPQQMVELMGLAVTHPENQWPLTRDIALGRNKHRTNTFTEIHDGLAGPYDWFESDVRVQDGRPVAAHDAGNHDGLTMAEWVRIGAASGRGLKFDFKESRAIDPVVQLVQQAGVADQRLLWNVTILSKDPRANAPMETILRLRRLFPNSVINLSIGVTPYTDATISKALAVAQQLGGNVMFPLDAAHVTPTVIAKFRQGGRVAIWNSPVTYNPINIPLDVAKFRAWGADGMIDLLSTHFSAGCGDAVDKVSVHVPGRGKHR
jgi:hypothetical protein